MTAEPLTDPVLTLAASIEARRGVPGPDPSLAFASPDDDPLVHQLVYAMLLWESSHEAAARCLEAVRAEVVDYNELRVCSAQELCEMLPRDCPLRPERATRLLGSLNAIFIREHALTLAQLNALPKREARQYLDGLDGIPQFAAARVLLVGLGGHAFPADARIGRVLSQAGLLSEDEAAAADLGPRLERAVRAADAARVYALLEAEAADLPGPRKSSARRAGRARTPAPADEPLAGQPGNEP